jgi:hypothetical protein
LALGAGIAIGIWCMAKPLGGPKVELSEPTRLLGAFVSRTNWALLIIGVRLKGDRRSGNRNPFHRTP